MEDDVLSNDDRLVDERRGGIEQGDTLVHQLVPDALPQLDLRQGELVAGVHTSDFPGIGETNGLDGAPGPSCGLQQRSEVELTAARWLQRLER